MRCERDGVNRKQSEERGQRIMKSLDTALIPVFVLGATSVMNECISFDVLSLHSVGNDLATFEAEMPGNHKHI